MLPRKVPWLLPNLHNVFLNSMENKAGPAENNGNSDASDGVVYDDDSAYYFEITIYKMIIITAISLYHKP